MGRGGLPIFLPYPHFYKHNLYTNLIFDKEKKYVRKIKYNGGFKFITDVRPTLS